MKPGKYGCYIPPNAYQEWEKDCVKWRGEILTGQYSHWCFEFDGLPVDETCGKEWDCCHCFDALGIKDGEETK